MITRNVSISKSAWTAVTLNKASNTSASASVEYWVGAEAPVSTSKGHILGPNAGLSADDFSDGDSFWFRALTDPIVLCVSE